MAAPTIGGFVIPSSVPAWSWAKIQFDLTGGAAPYSNVYDESVIKVDATITDPTGHVILPPTGTFTQPCYWARYPTVAGNVSGHGETYSALGAAHWWLAYKFPTPGIYTITITAKDAGGTTTSSVQTITVTGALSRLSPWRLANQFYFTFAADGSWINMIGQDLAVVDRDYTLDGSAGDAKFLAYVGANGGTVARYMLSSFHRNGIEWSPSAALYQGFDNFYLGLGQYSQQGAFRVDEFLRLAALNGVSVMFAYNTHGEFSTSSDPQWTNSPYNSANGGPIASSDPAGLFTNATALKWMKAKARYMIARWGASPAFGAIEHVNEGGSMGNGFFGTGLNTVANQAAFWQTMGLYIRSIDSWAHTLWWSELWDPPTGQELVLGLNTDPIAQLSTIDGFGLHAYQHSPWVINDRRHTAIDMAWAFQQRVGKPILHMEAGLYRTPSAPEPNFNPVTSGLSQIQKDHLLAGTHMRASMLASLASGFIGAWQWWFGSLAENAAQNRVSGTLPYGGTAKDTWQFPLDPTILPTGAAIAAAEDPTKWPTPGGRLVASAGAGLSVAAFGHSKRALVYVEDTADNYGGSDVANLVGRTEAGRTLTVNGLADGTYVVEIWPLRSPVKVVSFPGTGVNTQAAFLAMVADMTIDVIEIAGGSYSWTDVYIDVDRTNRPLTIRPAAGATVSFIGPGVTTDGIFFWGLNSQAKWITMDGGSAAGFTFDGVALSSCGCHEVRSSDHLTLRNFTFKNLTRDPAFSLHPYKSWLGYISVGGAGTNNDHLLIENWTGLAPVVSRDVSGIQVASTTGPNGAITIRNIVLTNYDYAFYCEVPTAALILDTLTLTNCGESGISVNIVDFAVNGSFKNITATASDGMDNDSTGSFVDAGGNTIAQV